MLVRQIVMIACSVACAWAAEEAIVRVQSQVDIAPKQDVTLGDIAEFSGIDKIYLPQLKAIRLSDVPGEGEERKLSAYAISSALRENLSSVQSQLEVPIRLILPKEVLVRRISDSLSEENVKKALIKIWQKTCGDCEFEVKRLQMPALSKQEIKRWDIESNLTRPRGPFNIGLRLEHSNGREQRLWITGEARAFKLAPTAHRSLNAGTRLAPDDIEMQRQDVTFVDDAFPSLDELKGALLSRSKKYGQMLVKGDIQRERLVKRGQKVKAVARDLSWEISIAGVSESDAFFGDKVNLRTNSSQKLVSGRAIGPGTVEVE